MSELKPFAWSWSALESFETCPKKHWHTRIKKDYQEAEGEAATWGKQVHTAMADRISRGKELPKEMATYEKHILPVTRNTEGVTMSVERQLAVTEDMRPCGYFDKRVDPWVRVVADVLKVREDTGVARIVDWKTGKGKYSPDPTTGENVADDSGQLKLSAAVVMAHFSKLQAVLTQYVWLQEGVVTDEVVLRADLPRFWSNMLPRVDRMEQAYRTTEYLPKPSGLCVRHCPVKSCPYHGRGNR